MCNQPLGVDLALSGVGFWAPHWNLRQDFRDATPKPPPAGRSRLRIPSTEVMTASEGTRGRHSAAGVGKPGKEVRALALFPRLALPHPRP